MLGDERVRGDDCVEETDDSGEECEEVEEDTDAGEDDKEQLSLCVMSACRAMSLTCL